MKKLLILALTIACHNQVTAQQEDTLYYFMNADSSLSGVKNSAGKVIIPAWYHEYFDNDTTVVKGPVIVLTRIDWNGKHTSQSAGDAYDRQGNLLYHPMFYDNGADFFNEGLTRCIADGKVGFADEQGKIVIPPQWDWVSPFEYGYAAVCNGCYWDRSRDEEHPPLMMRPGANTFYIDRNGARVPLQPATSHPKDQKLPGGYLPYPFHYSPFEQELVDSFNRSEVVSKIAFMNYYPARAGKGQWLQFEIISRPTSSLPFYKLMAYDWNDGYGSREDMIFLVDPKGEWFHFDAHTPYASWLKNNLEACRLYFKAHPDAPNKFDTSLFTDHQ